MTTEQKLERNIIIMGVEVPESFTHNKDLINALTSWKQRVEYHHGFRHNAESVRLIYKQIELYIERSGLERTIEYVHRSTQALNRLRRCDEIIDMDKDLYYPHPVATRYLQRTSRADRSSITINRPRNRKIPEQSPNQLDFGLPDCRS